MPEENLAEHFAQAFLEAARDKGVEKEVGEDLALLEKLCQDIPELLPFLAHPRIEPAAKEGLVQKLGKGLHPYTMNLLLVLVRRGRVGLLPRLSSAYFQAWEKAGGPVHVVVRTALPLPAGIQAQLRARLREALGRDVALAPEVAPELLAGAELVVAGRRLDASLRGRLVRLRRALGGGDAALR